MVKKKKQNPDNAPVDQDSCHNLGSLGSDFETIQENLLGSAFWIKTCGRKDAGPDKGKPGL